MSQIRRISSGVLIAGVLAGVMAIGTARVEAAGKKGGGSGAICTYLKTIIDYPYTNPTIKSWAIALYNYYECK